MVRLALLLLFLGLACPSGETRPATGERAERESVGLGQLGSKSMSPFPGQAIAWDADESTEVDEERHLAASTWEPSLSVRTPLKFEPTEGAPRESAVLAGGFARGPPSRS